MRGKYFVIVGAVLGLVANVVSAPAPQNANSADCSAGPTVYITRSPTETIDLSLAANSDTVYSTVVVTATTTPNVSVIYVTVHPTETETVGLGSPTNTLEMTSTRSVTETVLATSSAHGQLTSSTNSGEPSYALFSYYVSSSSTIWLNGSPKPSASLIVLTSAVTTSQTPTHSTTTEVRTTTLTSTMQTESVVQVTSTSTMTLSTTVFITQEYTITTLESKTRTSLTGAAAVSMVDGTSTSTETVQSTLTEELTITETETFESKTRASSTGAAGVSMADGISPLTETVRSTMTQELTVTKTENSMSNTSKSKTRETSKYTGTGLSGAALVSATGGIFTGISPVGWNASSYSADGLASSTAASPAAVSTSADATTGAGAYIESSVVNEPDIYRYLTPMSKPSSGFSVEPFIVTISARSELFVLNKPSIFPHFTPPVSKPSSVFSVESFSSTIAARSQPAFITATIFGSVVSWPDQYYTVTSELSSASPSAVLSTYNASSVTGTLSSAPTSAVLSTYDAGNVTGRSSSSASTSAVLSTYDAGEVTAPFTGGYSFNLLPTSLGTRSIPFFPLNTSDLATASVVDTSSASAVVTTRAGTLPSSSVSQRVWTSGNPSIPIFSIGSTGFSTPVANATSASSSSASPIPTACGEHGSFTLNWDDLPTLVANNLSDPNTVQPPPVFSPYHQLWFSTGLVDVPLPKAPYNPTSLPHLVEFIMNFNAGTNIEAGPDAIDLGTTAEIGNGPYMSLEYFAFNATGASMGCDSTGPNCEFQFTGLRYDATKKAAYEITTQIIDIPACPTLDNCNLIPVSFDDTFTRLNALRINVTVDGIPKIWFMDDLNLAWYNNTCAAGLLRQTHR